MTDDPKALALELERRGKPKTSVDARAAKKLRELESALDEAQHSRAEAAEIVLDVADRINDACNHGIGIYGSQTVAPLMEAYGLLTEGAALREQEGE